MKIHFKFYLFLVVAVSLLAVVAANPSALSKLQDEIEARLLNNVNLVVVGSKSARAYLDNDFEGGSASPWYDESPGYVNWRVENVSSPVEKNSTAPRPTTGTQYLRATRNTNLSSGLAVLKSPIFTANPGDRISFDFWIRSKRPEGNNLELVWLVGNTEYLLAGLSQFSTAANYEWRKQSVTIPVDIPTDGTLIFYGYCGSNIEDAIALDNIIVESNTFTTPAPGTNCITLSATIGTFTSPNYPSNYPNDANVCWLITGVSYVTLTFNSFSTETGRDILKIYLGATTSSELYGELSGSSSNFPSTIYRNTESMLFVFTSDSANTNSGFAIQYEVYRPTTTESTSTTSRITSTTSRRTTTEYPTFEYTTTDTTGTPAYSCATCGGTCYDVFGTITSPNFPYNYPNNLDCSILIRVPSGYRVELYFTNFKTESGYDYVTVYDGPSTSNSVISTLSGTTSLSVSIFSTSNQMLVRFTTDGSGTNSGWRANFNYY